MNKKKKKKKKKKKEDVKYIIYMKYIYINIMNR